MKAIENKLDDLLVKKAPYKLPENFKRGLVTAMPFLAVLGGIVSLLGAWNVYQLVSWVSNWMGVANDLGAAYGYYTGYSASFGPLLWLSLVLLIVEAVVSFMACGPLKALKKHGWDLMYWLALLNIVYSVIYLIAAPNIMQFIFSLIGSAIGLYLLFQIRSYYTVSSASRTSSASSTSSSSK